MFQYVLIVVRVKIFGLSFRVGLDNFEKNTDEMNLIES